MLETIPFKRLILLERSIHDSHPGVMPKKCRFAHLAIGDFCGQVDRPIGFRERYKICSL